MKIKLVILVLVLIGLQACGSWQGGGVRIGWENYNGAHETKTFTKDEDKK